VRSQVFRRVRYRFSIYPGTATIGFDAFPRRNQIRSRERLFQQALSPQASSVVMRRPCFITQRFRLGFTLPFCVTPRFRGLLMHCTVEHLGLQPSYSFGPSPQFSGYYGLC
jgi:hypothetical protein